MDLIVLLALAPLTKLIYKKIAFENYSLKWEYYAKAVLYGLIIAFTLLYGKNSISDVSPLD